MDSSVMLETCPAPDDSMQELGGHYSPRSTPPTQASPGTWLNETATLAANGDRQAAEQVVRHIQPMIQRYCRGRIGRAAGGNEAAEDVAQEACLGILSALPRYRGQRYPFTALALRIASNKVADHYRKRTADWSVPVDSLPECNDSAPTPEQAALHQELSERLQMLLSVLGASDREIITLRLIMDVSTDEAAQARGTTCGAIRVAQHRALNKLRAALPRSVTLAPQRA